MVRAGLAATSIAPPPGFAMAGYGTRTEGALGTHDDLEARVLWLEDGSARVALVAVDLVGVDASLADGIRRRLADVLPPEGLVLCATHTHAGPVVVRDRIGSRSDQPGAQDVAPAVEERVALAVRMARDAAQPTRLGWARGRVEGLGANRRRPDGPADHTITVVAVRDTGGRPLALVVRYACHPTVLDATNRFYSAEYPGAARRAVEVRAGVPMLFVNGSAGDVSTRFTRREATFEEVERFGALLADEVVRVLPTIVDAADQSLAVVARTIELPTRRLPPPDEAEAALRDAERRFSELRDRGAPAGETRVAETALFGARRTLKLARDGLQPTVEAPMTGLRLGPLTLVTLPGEPFTEVAEEIVRRAGGDVVVLGYTNGYVGYLPAPGEEDGYEVGASVVSPQGVQTLIAAASDLARDARRAAVA